MSGNYILRSAAWFLLVQCLTSVLQAAISILCVVEVDDFPTPSPGAVCSPVSASFGLLLSSDSQQKDLLVMYEAGHSGVHLVNIAPRKG